MKSPLVFAFWQDSGLAQLKTVLNRCGYRVEYFSAVDRLVAVLRKARPDLLVMDRPAVLSFADARGSQKLPNSVDKCPIVVLGEESPALGSLGVCCESLPLPLDIAALHRLIQKLLQHCPRKHLRMSVHLPGIIFREAGCSFGDILSLGTGGAFIKTGCNNLRRDETVDVIIPLMGMKKELEVKSRVIYHIHPTPENNYQQGVGISFSRPDPETVREIYEYISHSLLSGVSADTPHPRPQPESSDVAPSAVHARDGKRGLFLIS